MHLLLFQFHLFTFFDGFDEFSQMVLIQPIDSNQPIILNAQFWPIIWNDKNDFYMYIEPWQISTA
jgi:hypothetical protein